MIIIADSGSSNTNWLIIHNQQIVHSFITKGLNPYFTTSKEVESELKALFPTQIVPSDISSVFFYGSGCASGELNMTIQKGLNAFFPKTHIEINTDLLAAARALFFNDKGIAVICGTGSNTCYYNGNKIEKNIKSLGYILGDEGGGDYLGKLFITDFLNNELPIDIKKLFEDNYKLSPDEILMNIYKKSNPNAFLASFSTFISEHDEHPYFQKVISKSFTDMFEKHICKYENYQNLSIRCAGSIASHFEKHLMETAQKYNCNIDLIVKNPIERLAKYHMENDN